MTREELLRASIEEFRDHQENALFWTCERIFTSSGYCYILLRESRPISCAIHFNRSFESDENIGKYENNDMQINTREELDFGGVIEYKGLFCALVSQGNWNATMGQFHYMGAGSFGPISKLFLITNEEEVNKKIGVDSMPIFMNLEFGVPIVPSYYMAESQKSYVMVDVSYEGDITPIVSTRESYEQIKVDSVKLTFVNFTTHDAMKFLERLQNLSLSQEAEFGFLSTPGLQAKHTYQISFNWKALVYESSFRINYCLRGYYEKEKDIIRIREAFFKSLSFL